ncbi:c-type cytochrome [Cupriavidus gilardii]|uniref:c-type cytochrome n=1 Tax=Cupriavidus gilardii TaxID=82541 RepID=UPI0021BE06BE|nr:c-type cytochrome [Cupriavidus gilardii]MCT9123016.1 c-type cytochrome [Cupriavidus gilardii]
MLKEQIRRIAPPGAAALAMGLVLAGSAHAAPDIKALADKNGCFSCHGMQGKLIGPGFAEVAAKYKADGEAAGKLARKIQEGGKGVWGRIPMPPHPSLKDEEAKQLAAWVLEAG